VKFGILILVIFYGMAVKSFHRLLSTGLWAENWAEISSKKIPPIRAHASWQVCRAKCAAKRRIFFQP
jgi:hypothetical protein